MASKCDDNPKPPSAVVRSVLTTRRGAAAAAAAAASLIVLHHRSIVGADGGGGFFGSRDGAAAYYGVTVPRSTTLCPSMVRAGDGGDGGWWTCGESTVRSDGRSDGGRKCVVYSFGIRDNFSFDHYLSSRGCEVHGFDPSPAGLQSKGGYEEANKSEEEKEGGGGGLKGSATYHSYGLGSVDKEYGPGEVPFRWPGISYLSETNTQPWQLYRLPTIMSKLGTKDGLPILKVDIEGGEWDTMRDIVEADWDELYMELHFPPGEYRVSKSSDGEGMRVASTRHAAESSSSVAASTANQQQVGVGTGSSHGGSLLSSRRKKRLRAARNDPPPIDRIALLKMLMQVSDMFYWEPNGAKCVEIGFRRKHPEEASRGL